MLPTIPCRITNPFAEPGGYASLTDAHGRHGHHTGIDYGSAWPKPILGQLVRASLGGAVVLREYNRTMGNWVGVYNAQNDVLITYWHLLRINKQIEVGEWIPAYHPIGRVGSTGNSRAPHLHVQANPGRVFNYHAHTDPNRFLGIVDRAEAKKAYKQWRKEVKAGER